MKEQKISDKELSKMKVAVIVVADNIDSEIKDRFNESIGLSNPIPKVDIVMMENNRKKDELFNKCVLLNKALRKTLKGGYNVIIQTDIDLIIPPGTIDFSCRIALEGNVCCHLPMRKLPRKIILEHNHYDDYPWEKWIKEYKPIYATGCWNALRPKAWKMTGGFNEDMTEWGFEDRDWRARGRRQGVKWSDNWKWHRSFPLIHVNHPDRTYNNSAYNKKKVNKSKKSWL